jgi:hypothetical protein
MKTGAFLAGGLALWAVSLGSLRGQAPVKTEALVDKVKASINKGIVFLRRQQLDNGSWEANLPSAGIEGGWTSLAVLALLNAGVPADDPQVVRGLKFLRGLRPTQTYVVALQTMVFAEAKQNQDRVRIADNIKWLIKKRVFNNGEFRGWNYGNSNSNQGDNSNTQYALLGLLAGRQAGVEIKEEVWKSIRDYYIRTQLKTDFDDGGFNYMPHGKTGERGATLSMTAAGACGLLIAGMELNDRIACGVYKENEPVHRALSWISGPKGDRFKLDLAQRVYYNIYGIERVGRLSGMRFLGGHDWYREGCKYLVDEQQDNGSWWARGAFDQWPVVSTSFALLFLSKGRTPVLISKLVHTQSVPRQPDDLDWNNDRNDLRHLTDFVSKDLFNNLPLAWQIFDMMRAVNPRPGATEISEDDLLEVTSDMLQSPLVYFNGHKSPKFRFTAIERELLRKYVENGGFILAEACCDSAAFDAGFKDLVKDIWKESTLEYLPPEHPVWNAFHSVGPGNPYKLMGLQMGCKTVLVYSPQDMSCYWEMNKREEGRGKVAFRLGVNIVAYATGREPPRPRLTRVDLARENDPARIPRGFLEVAQLKYQGDFKPAPNAMRNLMDHMRKFAGVDVVLKTKEMFPSESVRDYKFLYLHGRARFSYSEEELDYLRFNLENGGLLLADACCGQEPFDVAFRKFAKELFPKHTLERIPADDVLFSKEINGVPLTAQNIRCRTERGGKLRNLAPFLEGIKVKDRWAVIYSKYDIGCALERHQASDCRGYQPESAFRLAGAAVLYSLRP